MRHLGILKKSGLIVLVVLLFLSLGWVYHYPGKVTATNLSPVVPPSPVHGTPGEDYVADQIIVKFKPGVDTVSQEQIDDALGTEVVHTSPYDGFKVLQIPEGKTVAETVAAYSEQSIVEYAEPNYIDRIIWSPNDSLYSAQWNFTQINLEAAWALDTTSPNYGGDSSIVVAVIDSGVAYETYSGFVQCPDLASTAFTSGYDYVNSDSHPNDDNSHGTHVTGTIAQSTNNSLGVAGIAFNTTIMPIKTLNADGEGTHAQMADGFGFARTNGAKIINYSAGGSHSTTKANAVAAASDAGVLIIAAMGNTGDGANTIEYPAAYNDYVIAVAATDYNNARSYYSSNGTHCDIAAPGGDTTENYSGVGNDGILQNTLNPNTKDVTDVNSYWLFQGTSMATPHVAGVAALILAKNPTWNAAQVRHALQSTATDLGTTGLDNYYGWGLVDALAAVNSSLATAASYSDATHSTACDNFTDFGTEHTVYMYSTGLLPSHSYRVAYYDSGGDKRDTQNDTSDASGNLTTQHTFVPETDVAGTWNVIVCETSYTPSSSYNATWEYTIASDDFTVNDTAIPEFPTVLAAIVTLSLCVGVYLWMRRKAVPVPA